MIFSLSLYDIYQPDIQEFYVIGKTNLDENESLATPKFLPTFQYQWPTIMIN